MTDTLHLTPDAIERLAQELTDKGIPRMSTITRARDVLIALFKENERLRKRLAEAEENEEAIAQLSNVKEDGLQRYEAVLQTIASLKTDWTTGADGNLEGAREIARAALEGEQS
jgi:hypothetical protein